MDEHCLATALMGVKHCDMGLTSSVHAHRSIVPFIVLSCKACAAKVVKVAGYMKLVTSVKAPQQTMFAWWAHVTQPEACITIRLMCLLRSREALYLQVFHLHEAGIPCGYFSAAQAPEEQMQVMSDLRSSQPTLKIIFITPERLARSDALLRALDTLNQRKLLDRVAIDEAHCEPLTACAPWLQICDGRQCE